MYELVDYLRGSYWMWAVCFQIYPRAGDIMNEKFEEK